MKKTILAVLAAFAVNANSAVLLTQPNQAGGSIALTDKSCDDPKHSGTLMSYLTNPRTNGTDFGCWFLDEETQTIFVSWNADRGVIRSYPFDTFTWTKEFQHRVEVYRANHKPESAQNNQDASAKKFSY